MAEIRSSETDEFIFGGVPVSPGFAEGTAFIYEKSEQDPATGTISESEVKEHLSLFHNARKIIKEELNSFKDNRFGKEVTDIINAQIEIVKDPELEKSVEKYIKDELYPAEKAIYKSFQKYLKLLSGSPESVVKDRSIDVADIQNRLIEVASGSYKLFEVESRHIVLAEELSPREIIQLAGKKIQGVIMSGGAHNSHAAIIARSIGIPAVANAPDAFQEVATGQKIALDAEYGRIILSPGKKTIEKFRAKAGSKSLLESYEEVINSPSHTRDGHPFILRANVGFTEELDTVNRVKAKGIGLLRTESAHLESNHLKDEKHQEIIYTRFLEETGTDLVTFRLFDIGGDKLNGDKIREENPFLGLRGIRMLLNQRDLLENQLRSILKVAAKFPGRARILIPMVSDLSEVLVAKKVIESVQLELADRDSTIGDNHYSLGVMIEIPSIVFQAGAVAKHVDFFSIGTNDLTQYLLAADRNSRIVADWYKQRHPAVWKCIHMVQNAAIGNEIEVSVCGELASDPVSAACLIGMGVDELSMGPNKIPEVKEMLVKKEKRDMTALADKILLCSTTEEVEKTFENWSN